MAYSIWSYQQKIGGSECLEPFVDIWFNQSNEIMSDIDWSLSSVQKAYELQLFLIPPECLDVLHNLTLENFENILEYIKAEEDGDADRVMFYEQKIQIVESKIEAEISRLEKEYNWEIE